MDHLGVGLGRVPGWLLSVEVGTGEVLHIAAGRDFTIAGAPSLTGLIAVHEQIVNSGDPEGVESAWLAEGACDSSNDWVDVTDISGNATISNSGPIASPFAGSNTVPVVMAWGEL